MDARNMLVNNPDAAHPFRDHFNFIVSAVSTAVELQANGASVKPALLSGLDAEHTVMCSGRRSFSAWDVFHCTTRHFVYRAVEG